MLEDKFCTKTCVAKRALIYAAPSAFLAATLCLRFAEIPSESVAHMMNISDKILLYSMPFAAGVFEYTDATSHQSSKRTLRTTGGIAASAATLWGTYIAGLFIGFGVYAFQKLSNYR